jgi:hypothetical protein
MDLLKAVALSAALMTPVVAGLQDLSSQDAPPAASESYTAAPRNIDSADLRGPVKTIQTDAKPDAIQQARL